MPTSVPSVPTIPHSRPCLGEKELAAVAETLRSGFIAQGTRVAAFEQEMARRLGVKGGVATSSGTAALHLALRALDVGEGDEVLLPTYACSALLHAVRAVRAVPRLVDSDPVSFNMDPDAARQARSPRAKALIVVHSFGLPADLDELRSLGLPLIEAGAQALGALYHGRPVGSVGEAAFFSFYATKLITTGEGGMLLSSDERILSAGRDLREYDKKEDDRARFNYKMTDLQAALGLTQLARLPDFLQRRRAIASRYRDHLQPLALRLPVAPAGLTPVYYRYVVEGPLPAEHYLSRLRALGVEAERPVFRPLHRSLGLTGFPRAEAAWDKAVSLPLYPSLRDEEIARVVAAALESFR
jgi:dTDP-4-amino-4,6-dideoxygalactose transaminase